ncbi:hypothetical protein [Halovivax limisalsi]|uniref:hypothetical protein n=1 Tax=Halovivax limisalsi TaxID=1453760 RepID=UPI001FFD217E|nr:hypothetical protein [Halovivax limisalsi]
MNRRTLIAHIEFGSIVGIAGCLGDGETHSNQEASGESDWRADAKNPDIGDQPCPPYETERDSAVCSHTVGSDEVSVYIEPHTEHSTLDDGTPVEEILLSIYNQSATELTFNPYSWSVWYNSGNGWEELQQELSVTGHLTISPDETHSWSFTEVVDSIQEEPTLEPALYAAELGVPDPENGDNWIGCIALVQLVAAD